VLNPVEKALVSLLSAKQMPKFTQGSRSIGQPCHLDQKALGSLSWVVNCSKVRYSRQTGKFMKEVSSQCGEGSVKETLQMIAEIHGCSNPENYEISVNATLAPQQAKTAQPVYFQVNFHYGSDVHWTINCGDAEPDFGTDSDELFATVESAINEQKSFCIEFETVDPTPQYLYDNSGGEPPVTASEMHAQSLQQKREAKG